MLPTARSPTPCPSVLPWAVPLRHRVWPVFLPITTTSPVASPSAVTRLMKVASKTRRASGRAPNAAVGHPHQRAMHPLARVEPAVIQTPVAATLLLLRTALHRHYRPPSPSLPMPRAHTRLTRAHPILRWALVHRRQRPHPCNNLPHLIIRMQAQPSSTTRAHMALPVMTSMLHSRD